MTTILGMRTRVCSPVLAVALIAAAGYRIPTLVSDSEFYLAMATGNHTEVPAPFAQRVAHPFAAQVLGALGIPLPAAFVAIAVACLIVYCVALRSLVRELSDLEYLLLAAVPFSVLMFREAYLPDLAFTSALIVFLLLLRRTSSPWWGIALIVPLFLVRESTLLIGLVVAAVFWRNGRRRVGAGALAATVAGYLVSSIVIASGTSTQHGVGGPLYLLAKIPYNGLKNLAGFSVYTDDTPLCTPWFRVPSPVSIGSIAEVGLCPFDPQYPTVTLMSWLTLFGVLPAVLLAAYRTRATRDLDEAWMRVALWTGTIAFTVAPLLGASVRRLAGYGWPALLVATALVLALRIPARERVTILAMSFALCWLPVALDVVLDGLTGIVVTVLVAIPLHVLAFRRARTGLTATTPQIERTPPGRQVGAAGPS